jgi:hypothetical protein
VSESPTQIGARFYAPLFGEGADLVQTIRDDACCEEAATVLDPGAPIRFITPGGGSLGALSSDFNGIEGFRAGWLEWLEPFAEYRAIPDGALDAGAGRVLFLVRTVARMHGSQAEIEQGAGTLLTAEGGLITALDQYLDHEQAKRAAGLAG